MNRLTLAGTALEHFHICAFFNSRDEEYDVLAPFFKEGLEQGEKTVHIMDPQRLDEHRRRLQEAGIDTAACEARGQLHLMTWHDAYLDEGGVFHKERMLRTVDDLTRGSEEPDGGYRRLRIMGDMNWAFMHTPIDEDLIEYEAEVNEVPARNRQPAICVYDVSKLTGEMMIDLLRTHPLTLVGGIVQENPFYTPPTEMLQELRQREAGGRAAG